MTEKVISNVDFLKKWAVHFSKHELRMMLPPITDAGQKHTCSECLGQC